MADRFQDLRAFVGQRFSAPKREAMLRAKQL